MKDEVAPDISVVIVNFNTKEEICVALSSLLEHTKELKLEIFVVDNASNDGSVEAIKEKFSDVKLIANRDNLGFAAANNQAFILSSAPYILMFNPDAYLIDDLSLLKMKRFLDDNSQFAAVAPYLQFPDGKWQHSLRRFPSPKRALLNVTLLDRLVNGKPLVSDYMLSENEHQYSHEAEQPMGACLLLRKRVVNEIGLLDERFFVYFEEVDWLKRAHDAGYKIYFLADARIAHIANAASNRLWSNSRRFFNESMIKFFRKHYGEKGALYIKGVLVLATPMQMLSVFKQVIQRRMKPKEPLEFLANYFLFLYRLMKV